MATQMNLSDAELAQRWAQRVAAGTFSTEVKGTGSIRVMGKSGDATATFPRITSLAVLDQLEPDEQWAVRQAQAVIEHAQASQRAVFAIQPGTAMLTPPVPVRSFNPFDESLVIVARVAGG